MASYEETLANNTGNNYGRLGIWSVALAFVTLIAIIAGWYSYIYYPEQVVLGDSETQPIRAEIPLDVMPALPDDLAATYDQAKADQLDRLVTFGAMDVENDIVRIPLDEAIGIMIESELFEVREGAPAPPEPAELEPAAAMETEEVPAETEAATEDVAVETETVTEEAVIETEAPAAETEAVTEAPTEAETEAPTEAETEAPAAETEAVTEAPTEAETEAPTEVETEAPTEPEATPVEPLTFE